MSSAVRDLAEAEFLGDRDEQNNPLPSRPIPSSDQIEVSGKLLKDYMKYFNFTFKLIQKYILPSFRLL